MKSRRTARSRRPSLPHRSRTRRTARASGPSVARVKVIKFSDVSKRFILHHERPRSFQEMVVNLFGLRTPSRRGVAMPAPVNEEFWALRDVNFGIYAGEAVGIIGENGSGKSTTLQANLAHPGADGWQRIRSRKVSARSSARASTPTWTGARTSSSTVAGVPRKEMQKRYESIVDFSELHEFIDTPIKHYSRHGDAARLRGGHQREPRHTPDRRSARGGRRGIPAEVPDHIAGL